MKTSFARKHNEVPQNGLQLYFMMTSQLDDLRADLDARLCDITANAFAKGDNETFRSAAAALNARYMELKDHRKDMLARINKYIDAEINKGRGEYAQLKQIFSDTDIDKIFTEPK